MDRLGRVLFLDGAAAVVGGVGSASSATTYVESSSGIADGARTGLASVVTGLLFVVALFLTPLVSLVPSEAADPGPGRGRGADAARRSGTSTSAPSPSAMPAALTMLLMPFTYSITVGVGAGFITYVVMQTLVGQEGAGDPPADVGGRGRVRDLLRIEPWIAHLVG